MKTQGSRQQAVILRIGLFFDGTGNNQGNSALACQQGAAMASGSSYANAPGNVALLSGLYQRGAQTFSDGRSARVFGIYVEGIGTTEGEDDAVYAQATGRGRTGVKARVSQALQAVAAQLLGWLGEHPLTPVAAIEFDLFGFSRGAAAARHLANDLRKPAGGQLGELLSGHARLAREFVINFIGLFDTVAAIVAPLSCNFNPANARHDGLMLDLPKTLACRVVQLVAADEYRYNFPLVRSAHDIVLPGAHSDVGGGYPQRVEENVLLCKPQSNQVSMTTSAQQTRAYAAVSALLATRYADSVLPRPEIIVWEEPLAFDRQQVHGREKRVYVALRREREVRAELSWVYLRIMRGLAVEGGVPFAALDEQAVDQRLPEELTEISRKLHDFALGRVATPGLTDEEQALLQRRYIHTSAHWNPVKGLRNSALDVLFPDRPVEGKRVVLG